VNAGSGAIPPNDGPPNDGPPSDRPPSDRPANDSQPSPDAPLVSVVMPAYNVEAFVAEAARSVLAQDWPRLELTAIDDGSTDATGALLDALAAEPLPPGRAFRVIRQANAGAAAARNAGLAAATGAVVAFMDADDRWHPPLASALMATLAADPAADLTFPLFRYIDEAGRATGTESRAPARRFDAADLLVANPIHSATGVFIRREAAEAAGRFDESLTSCIDLDFFVRVGLRREGAIVPTPRVLADYRRRSGQITGDWRRMRDNWRRVLAKAQAAGIDFPDSTRAIVSPMAEGFGATVMPGGRQDFDLFLRAFAEGADDRAGMAHLAALGGRQPGDIGHDGLGHVVADIGCGLGLLRAADLADHHHGVGFGSASNSSRMSRKLEPLIGSPPMPTLVETPMPSAFIWDAAS
jgi:glycosyltransferase involved in cell wall biosynthesis